ncbi:response regulator [Rhizobium paranaense]|uniref:response regulator n=1 Tax=Rhizobium TaxID=379 RepID=UPI00160CC899
MSYAAIDGLEANACGTVQTTGLGAADGWDVDWVVDLQAAKRADDAACYSLILLDPGLPDGCGLELLAHLSARLPATPAIVISADDQVTDRQRSLQLGAADCLVKPFSLGTLSARTKMCSGLPTTYRGECCARPIRRYD